MFKLMGGGILFSSKSWREYTTERYYEYQNSFSTNYDYAFLYRSAVRLIGTFI